MTIAKVLWEKSLAAWGTTSTSKNKGAAAFQGDPYRWPNRRTVRQCFRGRRKPRQFLDLNSALGTASTFDRFWHLCARRPTRRLYHHSDATGFTRSTRSSRLISASSRPERSTRNRSCRIHRYSVYCIDPRAMQCCSRRWTIPPQWMQHPSTTQAQVEHAVGLVVHAPGDLPRAGGADPPASKRADLGSLRSAAAGRLSRARHFRRSQASTAFEL